MDVLADVLSATRIEGSVFSHCHLLAPWGMRFPSGPAAVFHVLERGSAWLRVTGEPGPLQLHQGDVVLLPHGAGHSMASDRSESLRPYREVIAERVIPGERVHREPGLRVTTLMCGVYKFEHDEVHPLLGLLPPLIYVPASEGRMAGSLDAVLRLLSRESSGGGPGSSAVVTRLVDVMFIYIVRRWVEKQPDGATGWLGALRDDQIGPALAAIHRDPERDWDLEALASEVGMSRSSFARRFRRLVGEPPLGYLTRWRMDIAARLLRETDRPMAHIAGKVGYTSEFAFNRAFQRLRGVPPGRYRSRSRDGAAPSA